MGKLSDLRGKLSKPQHPQDIDRQLRELRAEWDSEPVKPPEPCKMVMIKSELPEDVKISSKITERIGDLISKMIGNRNDHIEEVFRTYLKLLAWPQIKGEITPGKLRWRGIVRVVESNSQDTWLEQRGKRISPIISGGCMLLHSPKRNEDFNQ